MSDDFGYFGDGLEGYAQYMTAFERNFDEHATDYDGLGGSDDFDDFGETDENDDSDDFDEDLDEDETDDEDLDDFDEADEDDVYDDADSVGAGAMHTDLVKTDATHADEHADSDKALAAKPDASEAKASETNLSAEEQVQQARNRANLGLFIEAILVFGEIIGLYFLASWIQSL